MVKRCLLIAWTLGLATLLVAGCHFPGEGKDLRVAPGQESSATPSKPTRYTHNLSKIHSVKPKFGNKESESRYLKIRDYMLSKNQPLNLFGRVVDQNGEPVSGVEMRFSVDFNNGIVRSDFGYDQRYARVYTDDDGRFAITNQVGLRLGIEELTKEGYRFTHKIDRLRVNYTVRGGKFQGEPTPETPVLFRSWKMGETAALIHDSKFIGLKPDGTVYTIDLTRKKIKLTGTTGGQLQVSCDRQNERRNPYGHLVFDWSVALAATSGGLIETNESFMFQAPVDGYVQSWKTSYTYGEDPWRSESKNNFYLMSENGRLFGRLELHTIPDYNELCAVEINYWVNPSGSRNLLYDEAKRIRVVR